MRSESSQPPPTLSTEVREKLLLPDFFEMEPPCDWNAIHYLNNFVRKNPTINVRSRNKALFDDANLMLKYVIPGTVAETMLKQMNRSQMMAKEVVDEMQDGHRKRTRVKDTDEEDNKEEGSDFEEGSEEEEDFWVSWKKLLKGLQECVTLPFLSSVRHDIIWCGKELRRRPLLPVDMYERLNSEKISIELQVVDSSFQPVVSQATDMIDLKGFKNRIEDLRNIITTTDAAEKL
ncbi:hypothetical protein BDC45DRAFT_538413 [Circinella umbellata]|nr:hypothetical protein BDC45DRAFT_538413 [Circinella umbellata]